MSIKDYMPEALNEVEEKQRAQEAWEADQNAKKDIAITKAFLKASTNEKKIARAIAHDTLLEVPFNGPERKGLLGEFKRYFHDTVFDFPNEKAARTAAENNEGYKYLQSQLEEQGYIVYIEGVAGRSVPGNGGRVASFDTARIKIEEIEYINSIKTTIASRPPNPQ